MKRNQRDGTPAPWPRIRCAIYTRKSTEEGLQQEFNSLDAQREAGEAFVLSQAAEGWVCLPDRYDDGGFTGGNMDRPALQRLLRDIQAGKVNAVVVYKIDRFSRSLLDFAKMMETFQQHQVSFISITQQFNSATSMGRLVLNMLLAFAQFERELISERTRDKIAATRRKGKWTGGHLVLGYDLDPRSLRLVVNADEAAQVQAIFALYLEHQGLLPVVQELARRGWVTKRWRTRKGHHRGGKPFTKTGLHQLLTNISYIGKVRFKDEVHAGEHAAIVDPDTWQKVQTLLQRNGRGGAPRRNQVGALLKGLLRCTPCNCAMTPSFTAKRGRRYRYYQCCAAAKRGWGTCPSKSIPAGEIEQLVVAQIQALGRDPVLLREVLAQARQQEAARWTELQAEQRNLAKELTRHHAELRQLSKQLRPGDDHVAVIGRLAEVQARINPVEQRAAEVRDQLQVLAQHALDEDEVAAALARFHPVWDALSPQEQARVLHLLIARVEYDGAKGKVAITFHPPGLQTLAEEWAGQRKEQSA
jgi:site-specific DNA recombinase